MKDSRKEHRDTRYDFWPPFDSVYLETSVFILKFIESKIKKKRAKNLELDYWMKEKLRYVTRIFFCKRYEWHLILFTIEFKSRIKINSFVISVFNRSINIRI